jgi:malonate transporter
LLSALLMSLLCLAIQPLLARLDVDGPAFTSIFQGATRWQTYVALAISSNFYGYAGLALASVVMVAIIRSSTCSVFPCWPIARRQKSNRSALSP